MPKIWRTFKESETGKRKVPGGHEKTHGYCVDMQKVIILPKLTTKESFFTSRLVCFNETFASGESGKNDFAIMWHEGIKGRKAGDVASSFVKFLVETGEKEPVFWVKTVPGKM